MNSNKIYNKIICKLKLIIYRISKNYCKSIINCSYISQKFLLKIMNNKAKFLRKFKHITFIILSITIVNGEENNWISPFFTEEQSNAIIENLKKMSSNNVIKNKQNKNKIEYKLDGICYSSPDNWTVWINGKSYNKVGWYKEFSIDEVLPDSITITTADSQTLYLSVRSEEVSNKNNISENNNHDTKDEQNLNKMDNNISENSSEQNKTESNNNQNNTNSDENNNTTQQKQKDHHPENFSKNYDNNVK